MPVYHLRDSDGVVVDVRARYQHGPPPEGCTIYRSRRQLVVGQVVPRRRGEAWPEGWISRGGLRLTSEQAVALRQRAHASGRGLDAYVATAIESAVAEGRDIVPAPTPTGPLVVLRIVCGPAASEWLHRRAEALGCTLASLVRGLLVGGEGL